MSAKPAAAGGWEVLEHARELSRRGEAFVLATVVWRRGPSSGKQGYRAVITPSGEVHGWIGGACAEPAVVGEARRALEEGTPRLMFLGTPEELESAGREGVRSVPISCQSEGALEIYIEPVEPAPELVVIGRSPMATTLVALAGDLGWRTVAVDPDAQQGTTRFPTADHTVAGLDLESAGVSPRSMVVVATQGHHDQEALQQALARDPAYVGLVASRPRGSSVLGYLRDVGHDDEELERIRIPAGLDLGPVAHEEIAVAILAELVKLRVEGDLELPLPTEGTAVQEATDPVCGMTVQIGPSTYQAEHDGQTYYFCCPSCQRTFEEDPEVHLETAAAQAAG